MDHSTKSIAVTRAIRLSVIVALLALLTGLLAIPQPARAETYEVTSTVSDGPGSLRKAIDEAKAHPGADTITFAASTDGQTIFLTGALDDTNVEGDLDILDVEDLTIQGNGAKNTIIDGSGNDRVFHICPGGGCTNTVTLSGMTIRNGSMTFGGGIYNEAGTTIVDGSSVSGNTANYGGGIYNKATLNVQNGSIVGEIAAPNTADVIGGGIYNKGGTATVDGSAISANTAASGGGIYNEGTLNVRNGSTIGGDSAGNRVNNNGGGIYNTSGTTTVDASTVSDNTADLRGGGIYNLTGMTTVNGSIVSANTAVLGGGIYNEATLDIQNGSSIGRIDAGNKADLGGGILNWIGTTTVTGSSVSANTAVLGGGIANYATLDILNGSAIGGFNAGNTAEKDGGGIYNFSGTMTVDDSVVSANKAINNDGGGIYNRGTLDIQNGSTIGGTGAGNTADDGGGIYNKTREMTVTGSIISDNMATNDGGGIYNRATLIVEKDSTIGGDGAGNTASGAGGGIYNALTTTVDDSTVNGNAAAYGGGIYNSGATMTVDGSTIGGTGTGNTATNDGGGIYNASGTTTVTGSRILNNSAITDGGGVYNNRDVAEATSVTGSCIVGNSDWSYYNNQPTKQIATGNWWGAAGGPIAPGADSVFGNVDVGGALDAPILGCAPDLQVGKANDTGGNGTVGTPFYWTLTISNSGLISATFDALQKILVDDLPEGPEYGAPVVGSFVDVTNSSNIQCSMASNTITCTAASGAVILGANTGSLEVTFSVTPSAAVTLVNPAGVCKVDPEGKVTENDESNNDCPVNVVNVGVSTNFLYLPVVMK